MSGTAAQLIEAARQGDTELFQNRLAVCEDQRVLYNVAVEGLRFFKEAALITYIFPVIEKIEDVNYIPSGEAIPLINQIIECVQIDNRAFSVMLLKRILEKGANPNDSRFWLPLMHTIDAEGDGRNQTGILPETDLLQLLLDYGATPALTDGQVVGRTPLKLAEGYEFQEAVQIIKQHLEGNCHV